jgi:anti-sigma regulatory factor (Ser/Thr protein kinase)
VSGAASDLAGGGFEFLVDVGPEAAQAARQEVLAGDGALPASIRDDLLLLLSEVVTNAVRYSGVGPEQSLRVALRWGEGRVRAEVVDPGRSFTAAQARPTPGECGGWGLFIVDRIADRWGVTPTSSGTSVWFEIAAEG